jgi:hypothetical protein
MLCAGKNAIGMLRKFAMARKTINTVSASPIGSVPQIADVVLQLTENGVLIGVWFRLEGIMCIHFTERRLARKRHFHFL